MPNYADPAVYPVGTPAATDNVMTRTAAGADGNFALGNLAGIAGLTAAADLSLYYNGTAWATYTVTSVARTLLAATTQTAQRTALGAADDTLVVHNFGAETIGGSKTCTDTWRWNLGTTGSIQYSTPGGNPGISLRNGNPASGDDAAFRTDIRAGAGSLSLAVATAAGSASPTTGIVINPSQSTYPIVTNAMSCGRAGNVWTQVFATNTTISTSDARLKTEPRQLREAEFKAFSAVCRLPPVWRWLNRVHGDENCEPEGKAARKHFGPTVQAAMQVFADNGLEAFENAPFCYDEWESEEATYDEDGNELTPAREAGDRYSFRKEELLCGMVSALARESDEKDAKIEAQQVELNELKEAMALLMARVAALESR